MKPFPVLAAVLAGICPLAAPGASAPPADCPAIDPVASAAAVCPAVDRPAGPALRVFLDRRTGRLRAPTAEEARALIESGGRGAEYLEPIEIVVHPNGMRTADLKGAFSYAAVARRGPDGKVSTTCIPTAARPEEK